MQPEDKTEMDPTGMQIQLAVDSKKKAMLYEGCDASVTQQVISHNLRVMLYSLVEQDMDSKAVNTSIVCGPATITMTRMGMSCSGDFSFIIPSFFSSDQPCGQSDKPGPLRKRSMCVLRRVSTQAAQLTC